MERGQTFEGNSGNSLMTQNDELWKHAGQHNRCNQQMKLASACKSLPLDFLLCIAKATQAASTFPIPFPRTPFFLLFSLTVSALWVDFKPVTPGLTCIWGGERNKMDRESEEIFFIGGSYPFQDINCASLGIVYSYL